MNAMEIYSGEFYAVPKYLPLGRGSFPHNCYKAKAIRVYKRRLPGNQRETAFVKMELYNTETDEFIRNDDYRARDVYDTWDLYEGELLHRLEQEKRRQEEQRILREKRDKEREERLAAEKAIQDEKQRKYAAKKTMIQNGLRDKGIQVEAVSFFGTNITITEAEIVAWLGLDAHPLWTSQNV